MAFGALLPIAALCTAGALMALRPPAPAGLDLLLEVPAMARLPRPVLEGVARQLARVDLAARDVVVTQGEPGDRWYVIADGALEALVDGRPVRTMGPGEAFGEIALLRDVPRSATVRAVTDAAVLSLEREASSPRWSAAAGRHGWASTRPP